MGIELDMVTDGDGITVTELYDAAMALSRGSFSGRHYAVAYHALAAALHAAYDLGDEDRLDVVGVVGEEQRQWLDVHEPDHELSAQAADRRGTSDVWATLRLEVQTRQRMLEHRRRIAPTQRPSG